MVFAPFAANFQHHFALEIRRVLLVHFELVLLWCLQLLRDLGSRYRLVLTIEAIEGAILLALELCVSHAAEQVLGHNQSFIAGEFGNFRQLPLVVKLGLRARLLQPCEELLACARVCSQELEWGALALRHS